VNRGHLETTILEADILTQMRRWLEPIGKAMPALNIQRALLDALLKMDIESSQLKASELGKVILFYTKNSKLDPAIRRTADQLVSEWIDPLSYYRGGVNTDSDVCSALDETDHKALCTDARPTSATC